MRDASGSTAHFSTDQSIDATVRAMAAIPAAVYKCVLPEEFARCMRAVTSLIDFWKSQNKKFIVHCAGENATSTRLWAAILGNAWTYIAAGTERTAAGQPTIEQLRWYHLDHKTPKTRLLGLFGYPLHQSRGWQLHNALLVLFGYTDRWLYLNFPDPDFRAAFTAWQPWLDGASITIPHKQTAVALCEEHSPEVQMTGVCNTILRRKDHWAAFNTDFLALRELLFPFQSRLRRALVVGTGATARSAIGKAKGTGKALPLLLPPLRSTVAGTCRSPYSRYSCWDGAQYGADAAIDSLFSSPNGARGSSAQPCRNTADENCTTTRGHHYDHRDRTVSPSGTLPISAFYERLSLYPANAAAMGTDPTPGNSREKLLQGQATESNRELMRMPIHIVVPPSKSFTHRAMVTGALAAPGTVIQSPLWAEDTQRTAKGLATLGVQWAYSATGLQVQNVVPPSQPVRLRLFVGDSGTTARFLTALAALLSTYEVHLDGTPRMRQRPLQPLLSALEQMGAKIQSTNGFLPIAVIGGSLHPAHVTLPGHISSQFLSALLFVAARLSGTTRIELSTSPVSTGYIRMTQWFLEQSGVEVSWKSEHQVMVAGYGAPLPAQTWQVERDWSAAAFWIDSSKTAYRVIPPSWRFCKMLAFRSSGPHKVF